MAFRSIAMLAWHLWTRPFGNASLEPLEYVLAKSWNTRMVPLCSKPGVLWCSLASPVCLGGNHPALSCRPIQHCVLSCELEKKSKARQLCRVQDMRHISNVESGNSKEMAKKDIRQQIRKSFLRWGAQWELPAMFQLWKLKGPAAFSVASRGAETFVTPMDLTELQFPYLQYEINQVYTAELLCELRELCSGLQQTLINVIILFFFLFGWAMQHMRSYFSDWGLNPYPLHWEVGVLTTRLPETSQCYYYFIITFHLLNVYN